MVSVVVCGGGEKEKSGMFRVGSVGKAVKLRDGLSVSNRLRLYILHCTLQNTLHEKRE